LETERTISRKSERVFDGTAIHARHRYLPLPPPQEADGSARSIEKKLAQGELVLSIVTMGELIFGATKRSQPETARKRLETLEMLTPVLPLNRAVANEYGTIRAELEKAGVSIGNSDLWIAAHAKALGLACNEQREGIPASAWVEFGELGELNGSVSENRPCRMFQNIN
jgi:tRNA(fMet)-specific endonuclease VapC